MTKHRRTKRKTQKGGGFWEFLGFGSSETTPAIEQPSMISSAISTVTDTTKNIVEGTEGYLEQAKQKSSNLISGVTSQFSPSTSTPTPSTSSSYAPSEQTASQQTMGGRRRSKSRKMQRSKYMKGGKGGLGLTYYATPVSGLKVVDPTYWIKGGSKRRKTRRKRH